MPTVVTWTHAFTGGGSKSVVGIGEDGGAAAGEPSPVAATSRQAQAPAIATSTSGSRQ